MIISVVDEGVTDGVGEGVLVIAFVGTGVSVDGNELEDSDNPDPPEDTSSGNVSIAPTTKLVVGFGADAAPSSGV